MLKRNVIIPLFLMLISISVNSQVLKDTILNQYVFSLPIDLIQPKNRIILFQNDSFIIYSTFNSTVANLKRFIDSHEIEEDKELLSKIFSTSKSLERNLQDIQNDPKLKSRLEFRIIELLEEGKCIVYDKPNKKYLNQICRSDYIEKWGSGIKFSTLEDKIIMNIRTGAF